ncbi:hypothetical protein GCM10010468_58920 [Actinocorallia longicatena]|uniref:CU044_5270 family protein n=1 Tax=Actinocorallia longicatena TaxID=111803 RepID=A0ABP6QHP1_9ACTN
MVGHGAAAPPVPERRLGSTDVLLVAAERLEARPLGAYWRTDQLQTQSYVVKVPTGSDAISGATTETFRWTAVRKGGGDLFSLRDLPAGPLTAADKAAWRRAGAPASFRVWSNDHYAAYRTGRPGPWTADGPQAGAGGRWPFTGFEKNGKMVRTPCPGSSGGTGCEKPVGYGATLEDLQAVDTRPEALLKRYTDATPFPVTDAQRLLRVSGDLADAPIPPRLQAAILRMIPSLPGVTRIEGVTDPLGRTGFALAAERGGEGEARQPYGSRTELMFALDGTYLGDRDVLTRPAGIYRSQQPGFVIRTWIVRSAGWSDTEPAPPAATAY